MLRLAIATVFVAALVAAPMSANAAHKIHKRHHSHHVTTGMSQGNTAARGNNANSMGGSNSMVGGNPNATEGRTGR